MWPFVVRPQKETREARSLAQILVKHAWFKMDQDIYGEGRLSYNTTDAIEMEPRVAMSI